VLAAAARGGSTGAIAAEVILSEGTVRNHLSARDGKAGCRQPSRGRPNRDRERLARLGQPRLTPDEGQERLVDLLKLVAADHDRKLIEGTTWAPLHATLVIVRSSRRREA
jgi:predicted ArsR family transcriptional regulator